MHSACKQIQQNVSDEMNSDNWFPWLSYFEWQMLSTVGKGTS